MYIISIFAGEAQYKPLNIFAFFAACTAEYNIISYSVD